MPCGISRRTFLVASSAAISIGWAKTSSIRVGCQANGFPLKPGDLNALLKALQSMKGLGYTGFECNFRLVEDQFERAADARASIESTGVRLIGPHANMQQLPPDKLAKLAVGVVALGGQCIVMSGRGLAENGAFHPAALRKKAAELNTLGKVCKGQGLRLAYHNHNPEFANHNAEIEGLAEHTDPSLVSFLMDAGHGYLGGGDPGAFMTRHAARIYMVKGLTYTTCAAN